MKGEGNGASSTAAISRNAPANGQPAAIESLSWLVGNCGGDGDPPFQGQWRVSLSLKSSGAWDPYQDSFRCGERRPQYLPNWRAWGIESDQLFTHPFEWKQTRPQCELLREAGQRRRRKKKRKTTKQGGCARGLVQAAPQISPSQGRFDYLSTTCIKSPQNESARRMWPFFSRLFLACLAGGFHPRKRVRIRQLERSKQDIPDENARLRFPPRAGERTHETDPGRGSCKGVSLRAQGASGCRGRRALMMEPAGENWRPPSSQWLSAFRIGVPAPVRQQAATTPLALERSLRHHRCRRARGSSEVWAKTRTIFAPSTILRRSGRDYRPRNAFGASSICDASAYGKQTGGARARERTEAVPHFPKRFRRLQSIAEHRRRPLQTRSFIPRPTREALTKISRWARDISSYVPCERTRWSRIEISGRHIPARM